MRRLLKSGGGYGKATNNGDGYNGNAFGFTFAFAIFKIVVGLNFEARTVPLLCYFSFTFSGCFAPRYCLKHRDNGATSMIEIPCWRLHKACCATI